MEACAAAYRLRLGMRGGTCGGDGGDDQIPCVKKPPTGWVYISTSRDSNLLRRRRDRDRQTEKSRAETDRQTDRQKKANPKEGTQEASQSCQLRPSPHVSIEASPKHPPSKSLLSPIMCGKLIAFSIWYKYLFSAPDYANGSDFASFEPGILMSRIRVRFPPQTTPYPQSFLAPWLLPTSHRSTIHLKRVQIEPSVSYLE